MIYLFSIRISNRAGQCNFWGQRDRSSFIFPGQRDNGTSSKSCHGTGWAETACQNPGRGMGRRKGRETGRRTERILTVPSCPIPRDRTGQVIKSMVLWLLMMIWKVKQPISLVFTPMQFLDQKSHKCP